MHRGRLSEFVKLPFLIVATTGVAIMATVVMVEAENVMGPMPSAPSAELKLPNNFVTDSNRVSRLLDDLVRQALERNPDLLAEDQALEASTDRILPAGVPDDPSVGFLLKDMPTTFSFNRESATQKQTYVTQHYPFPGKLTVSRKVATSQAQMTRDELHTQTLGLIAQVRSAFTDVFIADKGIQLTMEQRDRLRDFVDIATQKYRVGPGLQQDVLNADAALSRVEAELVELSRQRSSQVIQLAALLDLDTVEIAPLGVLPSSELKYSELELDQIAQATNPVIRRALDAVGRDQHRLRLANLSILPDFSFFAAYGIREDQVNPKPAYRPDMIRLGLSINLPVFYYSKQREQIAEAQAQLDRSRHRLDSARRAVRSALLDLLARFHQHEQVAAAFRRQVVPLAQNAVEAAISGYQVNQVDFLTLLEAEDKLDQYRTEYWRNEAERFRDLVKIEEVVGTDMVQK
jgi:cobalt-zinc-cadmium efflux system outer membrane protein